MVNLNTILLKNKCCEKKSGKNKYSKLIICTLLIMCPSMLLTQCSVMHKLTASRATSFPGSIARPRGGGVSGDTVGRGLSQEYLEIRRFQ